MAKLRTGDIQIEGLRELSKALKNLSPEQAKELRQANKDAAQIAADAARSRALARGGSAAKGASSIRASAGVRSASVGFGGARAPWMGGSEFGANREGQRRRSTGTYVGYRQFDVWRGSGRSAGYFVYPAIRASEDRIVEQYTQTLDQLIERNFPK